MMIDTRQAIGECPRAADLAARDRNGDAREKKEGVSIGRTVVDEAAGKRKRDSLATKEISQREE